jgi:hypothetical protein
MQVWKDSFERVIISSRSSFTQHWFFRKIVLSLIKAWGLLQQSKRSLFTLGENMNASMLNDPQARIAPAIRRCKQPT